MAKRNSGKASRKARTLGFIGAALAAAWAVVPGAEGPLQWLRHRTRR